jgi:hypothetical protein
MKRPILYSASRRTRPDSTARTPSGAERPKAPAAQASALPGSGSGSAGATSPGNAPPQPNRNRLAPMATRAAPPIEPSAPAPDKSLRRRVGARWQALRAHGPTRRPFSWLVALVLLGTLGWLVRATLLAQAGGFSQEDIDAAVSRTLETVTLPSQAARAYEVIRPSVVRVQAFREEEAAGAAKQSKAPHRGTPARPRTKTAVKATRRTPKKAATRAPARLTRNRPASRATRAWAPGWSSSTRA